MPKIAHIGCIPDNPISPITDVFVRIPCKNKKAMDDVVPSKQPMTTLFEQCVLLLGDIVAVMILAKRGVEVTEDLWFGHANLE